MRGEVSVAGERRVPLLPCLTVGADAPDHCGSLPWSTAVFTAWAFAGTASALGVPRVYFATCETGGVGARGIKHTGA